MAATWCTIIAAAVQRPSSVGRSSPPSRRWRATEGDRRAPATRSPLGIAGSKNEYWKCESLGACSPQLKGVCRVAPRACASANDGDEPSEGCAERAGRAHIRHQWGAPGGEVVHSPDVKRCLERLCARAGGLPGCGACPAAEGRRRCLAPDGGVEAPRFAACARRLARRRCAVAASNAPRTTPMERAPDHARRAAALRPQPPTVCARDAHPLLGGERWHNGERRRSEWMPSLCGARFDAARGSSTAAAICAADERRMPRMAAARPARSMPLIRQRTSAGRCCGGGASYLATKT